MRGTFSFMTTLLFASFLIIASGAQAQKKGQNVTVQYGTVIQKAVSYTHLTLPTN